ncbi:MAG: serine protease, partial [Sphingomonadaceae bacterium]
MKQFLLAWAAIFSALFSAVPAQAEQADVDAAARGVVRIVIIASDGERAAILGHGTGFAITRNKILTNAHVVEKAARYDDVGVGVIRAEGDDRWPARIIAYSPDNDLA